MADNTKNLQIVISGKDETGTAFSSVEQKLELTDKKAKSFSQSLGELSKSSIDMGKKLSAFASAPIVAFGGFAVKSGLELQSLQGSYERLTNVMKIKGDEMMSKMKEVSRGTINDTDLMLAANKAMSLGVIKNTDEMATLMEIARVKGQTMGLSMTQAFGDLVTGLGRGSAMILDNLGITIKVGEVNEAYAKSVGKTVEQLSAQEMKMALVNAVVSQGKEEMKQMGDIGMTNKEKYEKLMATFDNFKMQLGVMLIPYVTKFVEIVTQWISKFEGLDDRTKKIILVVGGLVVAAGPLLILIGSLGLAIQGLTVAFGILFSPIGLIALAIAGLIAVGVLLWKNWDEIKAKASEFWSMFKGVWSDGVNWLKGKIDSMIGWFDGLIDKIRSAIDWLKTYSGYNAMSSAIGKVSSAFGGGKAVGGYVRSGMSYLVGENGPEYFTPLSAGNITPNNKLGGGASIVINISGNTLLDSRAGEKIGDQIIRRLKLSNSL